MRCYQHAILLLGALVLFGCDSPVGEYAKMSDKVYVIVPDGQTSSFTDDLALVIRRYKLQPNVGSAIDDKGKTLHVLDAQGPDVRLRSENVLLSGQEDVSKCGIHSEPYPDPGQYFISVSTSGSRAADKRAKDLLNMISSDLRKGGYEVSSKPRLCSVHEG